MYTYVIESQGYYKIGKAENVSKRMLTYNTHNPQYKLLKVYHGNYEKWFHTVYKDKVVRGEWFQLTEQEIYSVCNAVFPKGIRKISYIENPAGKMWSKEEYEHNQKMRKIEYENKKILDKAITRKKAKRRIGLYELERRRIKAEKALKTIQGQ